MFAQFASTELPAPVIRNGRSVEANWATAYFSIRKALKDSIVSLIS